MTGAKNSAKDIWGMCVDSNPPISVSRPLAVQNHNPTPHRDVCLVALHWLVDLNRRAYLKRLYTRNKTNSGYKANVSLRTFQMPAPNAYEQCILAYKQQHVYFVTSNDSGLILSPCLIKNSRNIHVRSVTWLIFCSEIAFAWSLKTFEKQWF